MLDYAEPVTKLIDEFKRLPSIGQKSAQRLAFHILRSPKADVERLVAALHEVKERITECSVCNNLTDVNPCRFCASATRNRSLLCVIEQPYDLLAVEKTRSYKGLYHVLHGSLFADSRIRPSDLRVWIICFFV
jgi:recombination protein RecR